ncbi:MAG: ABC transporter ATP-binding protein [Rhodoglobus sp.]
MKSLVERRVHAAQQLLFLIGRAGWRAVTVTALVQFVAGLTAPLVILGAGVVVSAATGHSGSVVLGVALCASGLVVQQLTAPLQVALFSHVQLRIDSYVSQRLVDTVGAATNLRAVEQPEVIEYVSDANSALDLRAQTPGAASAGALALIARYTALAGTLALLAVVVSGPVALLGLVIALLNRFGQTFAFSIWAATSVRFNPARRRMQYLRNLVTNPLIARDIRMLRLTAWIEQRYRDEAQRYFRPLWWSRRRVYGSTFLVYAIATVVGSSILIAVAVIVLSARGTPQPGALAIVLQSAITCVMFGKMFPEADVFMQYGRIAWEAILSVEEALRTGPIAAADATAAQGAPSMEGDGQAELALHDVVYRYTTDNDVLKGVSLRLVAGTSMALVGVNGAGKSTLVKLLAGFYTPESGRVTVDGVELTPGERLAWQKSIAVVFQDYLQYELTLRQNVAMQAPDEVQDDAGLVQTLRDVGLGDAYDALPSGLDTPLSRLLPGGTDLSGGQWQRLALARALYAVRHGARALVLDEPTSQMDARGEAEFYDNFLQLTRGITTLIISHRFSSVRQADSIAVLADGVITELGTHQELVHLGGEYSRMFQAQSSRYVIPSASSEVGAESE